MRPTRLRLLIALGLGAVPIGWMLGRVVDALGYGLPSVPRGTPLLLVFFALILLVAARVVRGWVEERRYDRRMDALRAARMVALAKAGAVFGAVVAGVYTGMLVLLLQTTGLDVTRERFLLLAVTVVAGLAVVLAALRLERACTVPPGDDEQDKSIDRRDLPELPGDHAEMVARVPGSPPRPDDRARRART